MGAGVTQSLPDAVRASTVGRYQPGTRGAMTCIRSCGSGRAATKAFAVVAGSPSRLAIVSAIALCKSTCVLEVQARGVRGGRVVWVAQVRSAMDLARSGPIPGTLDRSAPLSHGRIATTRSTVGLLGRPRREEMSATDAVLRSTWLPLHSVPTGAIADNGSLTLAVGFAMSMAGGCPVAAAALAAGRKARPAANRTAAVAAAPSRLGRRCRARREGNTQSPGVLWRALAGR